MHLYQKPMKHQILTYNNCDLSKVINDMNLVEKAMEQLDNRETTTTYKLTKVKK